MKDCPPGSYLAVDHPRFLSILNLKIVHQLNRSREDFKPGPGRHESDPQEDVHSPDENYLPAVQAGH